MLRILLLPRRGLHLVEAAAHDDLHVARAEAARRAAAVHRGVAAAEHDDARADPLDVTERDRSEPIDADMDVRRRLAAPGQVQIAPARCAAADEDRVPAAVGEQVLHRIDALAGAKFDTEVQDVAGLLVDHRLRQPKARDLGAHETAGLRLGVEHRHRVAARREVARYGERRRPGADAGDALAVAARSLRHARQHVALVVGGDALQAADRNRFRLFPTALLDPRAAARRFARPVAGAAEDAGEDIRHPVHHVGVGIAAGGDQADVLGDRGVGRARPLAIDDLVEIGGIDDVRCLQSSLQCRTRSSRCPRSLRPALVRCRAQG